MAAGPDEEMVDPDLKLPEQFTFIPIRALRMTSRKKLAQFLNLEGSLIVCETDTGYGEDGLDIVNNYNGLAELIQLDYLEISNIMRCKSPTEELLNQWTSATEGGRMAAATVGNLWKFLYMMERFDVLKDCRRTICNDCRIFEEHRMLEQESQRYNIEQDPTVSSNSEMKVDETKFVDKDSVLTGQSIHYNAFISYNHDDSEDLRFVRMMIKELEQERNLKLFVPGRDDLPGSAYHVITAYLIEKRCDRVVLVLSKSFLKSAACDFQLKFAHALAPGARSKKLIPVLRTKNTYIPRILKFLAVCDFSKTDMRDWVIDRLYSAIIAPIGQETFYDQFESEEFDEDTCKRARLELENSTYPQSYMNRFSSSAFSIQGDTASSSGIGSSMPATPTGSISSLSQVSDIPSRTPCEDICIDSDETIMADSEIEVSPGSYETISQMSGSSSSISQYFPRVHSVVHSERPRYSPNHSQSQSAVVKAPNKSSTGKSVKKLIASFGKGRTKKRNVSPKGETHEDVRASHFEILPQQVDSSGKYVRKYNTGILPSESESADNVGDHRVCTSSEEFVKLDIGPTERVDCESQGTSPNKVQCSPAGRSQSAVLGNGQSSGQEISLGYRQTVSEVVRKAKPVIPPKPTTNQRRSRSPNDKKSKEQIEQSEQTIHYV